MNNDFTNFKSLIDLTNRFPDEKACRDFLSQIRWNDKPICVHCGNSEKIYRINDGKILKCSKCRKQFTVKIGTIFEDSALPLQKWFMAIYLITAHKKGISSMQLSRDIAVTQKTAWFVLHRIRYAIRTKSFVKPLEGTVEIDETYVGGKKKNAIYGGRNTFNKTIVVGAVQRNGKVVAQVVPNAGTKQLVGFVSETVKEGSNVMTDEWRAYSNLSEDYNHQTINHSADEYVRGEVHTNSVEGFWAMLKRGIYGIYHHVSREHLDKYVDEFEFRYNTKSQTDVQRFSSMLNECNGRLTYKKLIAS